MRRRAVLTVGVAAIASVAGCAEPPADGGDNKANSNGNETGDNGSGDEETDDSEQTATTTSQRGNSGGGDGSDGVTLNVRMGLEPSDVEGAFVVFEVLVGEIEGGQVGRVSAEIERPTGEVITRSSSATLPTDVEAGDVIYFTRQGDGIGISVNSYAGAGAIPEELANAPAASFTATLSTDDRTLSYDFDKSDLPEA